MNKDRNTRFLLVIIALLLTLNLIKSFIQIPVVQANEAGNDTGRYQISIWSVQGNSQSFNPNGSYGYYIFDTKTGKILDERRNNL
jgi:hypothetical protein